jgi:hypothetical protein
MNIALIENMREIMRLKYRIALWVFALSTGAIGSELMAQNVNATAELDSTVIFIGGQINLKLEVSQPKGIKVQFPQLTDTITKNIEIIEKSKIDSIHVDNNRIVLTQSYLITSFDSGLHYIPPVQFEIDDNENKNLTSSNALSLMVVNPFKQVKPEEGIFDIKGVINTPFKLSEILDLIFIYGGIVFLIALLVWGYLYYKKKFIHSESEYKNPVPTEPAHIIALRELDKIKAAKLWEKNKTKPFYTQVSNTLRAYIEHKYSIPALEQTSVEIINTVKQELDLTKDSLEKLSQVLELSDLVKFAKFEPLADENSQSLTNAYAFVNTTKNEALSISEPEEFANKDLNKPQA